MSDTSELPNISAHTNMVSLSGPCYICQDGYMSKPVIEMETLFKALADETRLRILALLLTGEVCVCNIHESLKIPQSKASRHLAYLRRSGLVETRRDGLWIHYRLGRRADPVLGAIVDAVRHALAHLDGVKKDANGFSDEPDAACR